MKLCPRCSGGEVYAPNCPSCDGCGYINSSVKIQHDKPKVLSAPFSRLGDSATLPASGKKSGKKKKRVRVFKVKMTPEERRRAEQESMAKKREAMRLATKAESAARWQARAKSKDQYVNTPDGVVAKSTFKPNRRVDHGPDPLPQAPLSKKISLSKWSSPKHSERRRETLERKLTAYEANQAELAHQRESREEQSAKVARNTQLADKLGALLGTVQLHPTSPAESTPAPKPSPAPAASPVSRERYEPVAKPKVSKKGKPRATQARQKPKQSYPGAKLKKANSDRDDGPRFMKVCNGRLQSADEVTTTKSERRLASLKRDRPGGVTKDFPGSDEDLPLPAGSRQRTDFFESRHQEEDGGRYMGHSFREADGRFGSLPLYDDYDN